ncbi:MAG: carbonic anhydrase [archaeon]
MRDTLQSLLEGNLRHATAFADRFDHLQDGQHPQAVTVCCSDSRVMQDHIVDNDEPGRLFTCGNIGNRVLQQAENDRFVSGDVLYPLAHTGTETVVVVGHTGCGAVTATYDHLTDGIDEPAGIEYSIELLASMLESGVEALPADVDRETAINYLVEYNVDRQIEFLAGSDEVPDGTDLVGLVYDFQDVYSDRRGELHVINVDGETDPAILRERYPAIAARVDRQWTY